MTLLTFVDAEEAPGFDIILNELIASHLKVWGGYPYDYCIQEETVIIAGLDDAKDRNRTQLMWHDISMLKEWQSAWELREDEDDSIWEYTPDSYE